MMIPIWVTEDDFLQFLYYKFKARGNYYFFVEGVNIVFSMFILAILSLLFLFTGNSNFPDSLANLKTSALVLEIVLLAVCSLLLFFITTFSGHSSTLLMRLGLFIALISGLIIMLFSYKYFIDVKYNNTKNYEKYFQSYCEDKNISPKQQVQPNYAVDFWKLDISSSNLHDTYISACNQEYLRFSVKYYINVVFLILLLAGSIYLLIQSIIKKDKINRVIVDDSIINDTTTNVKY